MAVLLSVAQPNRGGKKTGPVEVRAPSDVGSGLVGDGVFDSANHGGDAREGHDQAGDEVSAVSRPEPDVTISVTFRMPKRCATRRRGALARLELRNR